MNLTKLSHDVAKNRTSILYTILIFINHFAFGITTNIIGACLVDLRYIYSASLNNISYLPIAYGLGYLLGSQAPYLHRFFNRQLLLIYFLFLVSITIAFLPHYGSLQVALPALALNGVGGGAWDASVMIFLVELWTGSSAPVINGGNVMYGLGTIAAPMLVAPFVHGETNVTASGSGLSVQDRIDALSLPFAVTGLVQLVVPIILLVLHFKLRYVKPSQASKNSSSVQIQDPETAANPKTTRIANRRTKLYLCGLCLSCYATARIGYFSFCTALYQNLPIHLSAATSAHILSVLSSSYMFGRLTSALISFKIVPDTVISCHIVMLLTAISIIFCGRNDLGWITVGTALLGYGFSAMWAGLFAYTDRHLRLTDRVCALYTLLSGSISMIIPLAMGQVFETNPVIFFYLELFFISTCLVLFVIVRIWISLDNRTAVIKYSYVQ